MSRRRDKTLITIPAAHGSIFVKRERLKQDGVWYHLSFGTRGANVQLASWRSRTLAHERAKRVRRALHGKVLIKV